MTNLIHQSFFKYFVSVKYFDFFGGGSSGSIAGDLEIEIFIITDYQTVLKEGGSLWHVVTRVLSMDIGARF